MVMDMYSYDICKVHIIRVYIYRGNSLIWHSCFQFTIPYNMSSNASITYNMGQVYAHTMHVTYIIIYPWVTQYDRDQMSTILLCAHGS